MPRADYKTCRSCGRHVDECGELSHTRLCSACSVPRFTANLDAMRTMSGPYARRWRERMAASVGAQLLDERDNAA